MSDDPISDALHLIPYGFYAITSRSDDDVNIMVANWLTQASFEPRRIALGLQRDSYTHGLVESGRVFAINLFDKTDADALEPFTNSRNRKPDKVASAKYTPAPQTGCPVLERAAAYIECKVIDIVNHGGDHDIVIGEVVGAEVRKPTEVADVLTLPFLGWSYAG